MLSAYNVQVSYFALILISCLPLLIYGLISPFSKTYLIISYFLFIFLNIYGSIVTISRKTLSVLLYITISIILTVLIFISVFDYIFIVLALFFIGLVMSILFHTKVELRELRNVMVAQQLFFPLVISIALLNVNNVLSIKKIHFFSVHPFSFVHLGTVSLFIGYALFNAKILDQVKLINLGIYCIFGSLIILSIGIFDILINYNLSTLAIICLLGGVIASIGLIYNYKKPKKPDVLP